MSLDKKYQIPPDTIRNMVRDGVISFTTVRNHEIYDYFISFRSSNPSKSTMDLYQEVGDHYHLSSETIRVIVTGFVKKS